MDTASQRSGRVASDAKIAAHAKLLSGQLQSLGSRLFPPDSRKSLRSFSSGEAARLLNVSDGYLRQLSIDGIGPTPEVSQTGRRSYTLAQINELRRYIANAKPRDADVILPHRKPGERLQTIACVNFKGGSAKTTTALYLAQFLALSGYRVLALISIPRPR